MNIFGGKMSYHQMLSPEPKSEQVFEKISCEKTGTIYYEHPVTKERKWTLKSTKENKK